jgi:hypothetical protein
MSCPCRSARGAGDPGGHNNQVRNNGRCWCWCHQPNRPDVPSVARLDPESESLANDVPLCQVGNCADDPADARAATYVLPQSDGRGGYTWALVCESHADGWWDPDDPVALDVKYRLMRLR